MRVAVAEPRGWHPVGTRAVACSRWRKGKSCVQSVCNVESCCQSRWRRRATISLCDVADSLVSEVRHSRVDDFVGGKPLLHHRLLFLPCASDCYVCQRKAVPYQYGRRSRAILLMLSRLCSAYLTVGDKSRPIQWPISWKTRFVNPRRGHRL